MSRNDKQKAAGKSLLVQHVPVRYKRFSQELMPDRYAAPEKPLSGYVAERIAEACNVSVATARRWKAGTSRMPATARAIIFGELDMFSPNWRGWKIRGDNIISPEGWTVSRNDALSVQFMHSQIHALRQRISELEALTDDQPYPGAYPDSIKA